MEYNNQPLVSICMITYNHSLYIQDAIDGVIMQQCNFPFQLVIGEDCSTDNTRDICDTNKKAHPEIIKLLPSITNIGMIPNFHRTIKACNSKYIAFCEGDDYWTDPYKLQKQVDFLEVNPEYSLVHSDGDYYYTKSGNFVSNYIQKRLHEPNKVTNIFEAILRSEYPINTCSVVYRNKIFDDLIFAEMQKFNMGDTFLWLELTQKGKFYFFSENMITRNILIESVSQSNSYEKLLAFKKSGYELCKYFMAKYKTSEETKKIVHEKFNRVILSFAFLGNDKPEAEKAYKKLRSMNKENITLIDKIYYFGSKNLIQKQLALVIQLQLKIWKRVFIKK